MCRVQGLGLGNLLWSRVQGWVKDAWNINSFLPTTQLPTKRSQISEKAGPMCSGLGPANPEKPSPIP